MTDLVPPTHIVPIQRGQCTAMITPKWFVDGSEYHPQLATYRPMVNGKEAFGEVYRAIEAAERSVCIICWGFQPSMYFVRDGTQMMIGQLLEKKAKQGKMVRVLCWAFERLAIGGFRINVTGYEKGLGESNTPGRWTIGISDRPATETDEQYAYDVHWYTMYDRKADWVAKDRRTWRDARNLPKNNLLFYSRSYSQQDTAALQSLEYTDKELSWRTLLALQQTPSHHQKMVLVDYEDPQAAVGFVMGHNMLDFYWDTPDHCGGPPKPPNVGRNGSSPLHDYSSRVTGPIIGDLFHNFSHAWERETGESLPKPDFCSYPLLGNDVITLCQILRTQPQPEGMLSVLTKKNKPRRDIADCYMQAVSNATQCIVIENQYFRWPPFAEKIKESAAKMVKEGRSPQKHGYLYLFVITNTSDGGMGAGVVNTYRMLEALGRADRIPEVARHQRAEALDRQIKAIDKDLGAIEREMHPGYAPIQEEYAPIKEDMATLKARKAKLEARKRELEQRKARLKPPAGSKQEGETIVPSEVPGLKVHIATLVAPDTAPGEAWQEVYIHAKLMMIDDTFMTAGSANINTRSMQTDTELNIMHDRYETTKPLRERQWERYTRGKDENGKGVARIPIGTPLETAFIQWGKLMNENAKAQNKPQSPLAQLHEFLRTNNKIRNDD